MKNNRHFEIKFSPWNAPTDLTEPSFDVVLRTFETIMLNGYVGILHRDPKSIRIDRNKVKLAIPQEHGTTRSAS